MKHKLLVLFAAFLMLGFFCIIKVNATSITPIQVNSCNLQNLQSCNRDDLIKVLVQLIMQLVGDQGETTTPPNTGDSQYTISKSLSSPASSVVFPQEGLKTVVYDVNTTKDFVLNNILFYIENIYFLSKAELRLNGIAVQTIVPTKELIEFKNLNFKFLNNNSVSNLGALDCVTKGHEWDQTKCIAHNKIELVVDVTEPSFGNTGANIKTSLMEVDFISNGESVRKVYRGQEEYAGNDIYIHKAVPQIESSPLLSSVLTAGTNTLSKFMLSAKGQGDITWKKIAFSITKASELNINDLHIYKNGNEVLGSFTTVGSSYIFNAQDEQRISSATGTTYELRANVSGNITKDSYITTYIQNTSLKHLVSNFAGVAQSGSFVWSDMSGMVHSLTTRDWMTEYLIPYLSVHQTISKNGENTNLPDLVVEDIFYENGYIKVKYCNNGGSAGSNKFLVKIKNEKTGKEFPGNSYYGFNIPNPGACAVTGGFTCGLIGLSYGQQTTVSATIDWENKVAEGNENNNKFEKVLNTSSANEKKILSPTAGVTLCVKGSIDIKWQGEKNTLYKAFIEKADKSKTWEFAFSDITTDENGIGIYTWKYIGEEFNDNNKYRIYVKPQTKDTLKNDDIISVDNITVSDCSKETAKINITFPTEKDVLTAEKTYTIKWESQNLTGDEIQIFGNRSTLITSLPITATSYTWTVPQSYGDAGSGVIWVGSSKNGIWEKIVNVEFKVVKAITKDYSKFSATEVVEDNLPESITLWSAAFCPNINTKAKYTIPEGYELVSCEMGQTGTHGGCSYCAMAKIKLKAKASTSNNSYVKIKNTSFSNLCKGDTFKIAWETDFDKVAVGYEKKSGGFISLGEYDKNTTSINWKAGTDGQGNYINITSGEEEYVRLKITAKDANNITKYAYSEYFKIGDCGNPVVPPNIQKKVISPEAGAKLCVGEDMFIKWQGESNASYYMEVVSGTKGWVIAYDVKTNSEGIGNYAWKVEDYPSDNSSYQIVLQGQNTTASDVIKSEYVTISKCEINDTACATLYDPVCGKDGRTYSNSCEAEKAGVTVNFKGDCSKSKAIPCGKYGDINGDGKINYADIEDGYNKVGDASVDLLTIDVDGNGEAGFNDVVLINDYFTDKISTFNVCKSVLGKTSPCPPMGDANQDGYITEEDYVLISKCSIGNCAPNVNKDNCDLNANGQIDIGDAANMDYFLKGRVNTFNACNNTQNITTDGSGSIFNNFKNFLQGLINF
ncbi:MAG TPA: Kazal-type serine protease inhibitor domain-containing protein [Candidatus Pacearchaeota archaeon]|nr:Kazal-type serine protease inhibitor domain-containing protein [Candidatus Pacearchaeota archaeon]